jgi:hypothetical protein
MRFAFFHGPSRSSLLRAHTRPAYADFSVELGRSLEDASLGAANPPRVAVAGREYSSLFFAYDQISNERR